MSQLINFFSPSKGVLTLERVTSEIVSYCDEDPKRNYKIVIGTDSQSQGQSADFVTAVVVHRVGSGGRYFWRKNTKQKIFNLRQRIYEEVNFSLVMAQDLINSLKNYFSPESLLSKGLEIHVDIGVNGETKEMIKEAVGIVRGNGFNVKTKPEAYGASKVADKHT